MLHFTCEKAKDFFLDTSFGPQSNLSLVMDDTKRGLPKESLRSNFGDITKKMIENRLIDIVKPQSMIFLSTQTVENNAHVVSIYQNASDNKIYYYDINNLPETEVKDISELTKKVWESIDPSSFRTRGQFYPIELTLRNVSVDVLRFQSDPACTYEVAANEKISNIELVDFVKNNKAFPLLDAEKGGLIDSIEPAQLYQLLKDESIDEKAKKRLITSTIKNLKKLNPFNAHLIISKHSQLLSDLRGKGVITESDFDNVSSMTKGSLIRRGDWERAFNATPEVKGFLDLYSKGLIDDDDIKKGAIQNQVVSSLYRH